MKNKHERLQLNIRESFISGNYPFIGASPDGFTM